MNTGVSSGSPGNYGPGYSNNQTHYRAASNGSVDRAQNARHAPPPQNPYPGPPLPQQHSLHRISTSVEVANAYNGNVHGPGHHEQRRSVSGTPVVASQSNSPAIHQQGPRYTTLQENQPNPLHFQYEQSRGVPLATPPVSGGQPNLSIKTQLNHPMAHNPQHSVTFPPQPNPLAPNRRATISGGLQTFPQQAPLHVNDPASAIRQQVDTPVASPHTTHSSRRNENYSPPKNVQYPVEPVIQNAADAALQPVRSALEAVLSVSVNQMRQAMAKMHYDFTQILNQERQKISLQSHHLDQATTKLRGMDELAQALQKDKKILEEKYLAAKGIIDSFKAEYAKLRTDHDHLRLKYEVLAKLDRDQKGGGEGRDLLKHVDLNSVVGAVSEQVSKQMEGKMAEIMTEMQEQKAMRVQAEQKIAETLEQLNEARQGQPRRESFALDQQFSSHRTGGPSQEPSPAPLHHSTHFRTSPSPMLGNMVYDKRPSISSHSSSSTRVGKPSTSPSSAKQRLPAPEPSIHPGYGDRRPALPENMYRSPQSTRTSPLLGSPMQIHSEPLSTRSRPTQTPIAQNFSPQTPSSIFSSPPLKRSRAQYEADDQRPTPTSEPPQSRARTESVPPPRQPVAQPSNHSNIQRPLSPAQVEPTPTYFTRQEDADPPVVIKTEPRDDMNHEEGEIGNASSQPGRSRPPSSRSEPSVPPVASRLPTPPQSAPVVGHRPLPSNPSNQPNPPGTESGSPSGSRSVLPNISRPRISSVPRPTAARTNTLEKPADKPPSTPMNTTFNRSRPQESRVDNNLQTRPPVPQPPTPQLPPPPPRPKHLGISHIDLLYKTENGSMQCRMCITRKKDAILKGEEHEALPMAKYPADASWPELITHCQSEHPKACADLEKFSPTQIAEMKQRMAAGDGPVRRK